MSESNTTCKHHCAHGAAATAASVLTLLLLLASPAWAGDTGAAAAAPAAESARAPAESAAPAAAAVTLNEVLVYSNTTDPTYWYYPYWDPPQYFGDDVTLAGTQRVGARYEIGLTVQTGSLELLTELWTGGAWTGPETPVPGSACAFQGLTGTHVTVVCTLPGPPNEVILPDQLWVVMQKGAASVDHGIWIADEAEVGYTDMGFALGTPGDGWTIYWFGPPPWPGFWIEVYATAGPSVCDLDGDGDVDEDDFWVFVDAYGSCAGDPNYLSLADLNGDGCVTLADYVDWLECYRDVNGQDFDAPIPLPGDGTPLLPTPDTEDA